MKARRAGGPGIPSIGTVVPVLFLVLFFALPLLMVLFRLSTGGEPSDADRFRIDPYLIRITGFTLLQAALSTMFALVLGIPGAWILARYRFPGRRLLRSLTAIPFVLPPILLVLGFILFFGNQGHLNRMFMILFRLEEPPFRVLYSLRAIILAHGFYNFPIAVRVVGAVWQGVSRSRADAARSLGANGFQVFRTVTLPQILPGILSAALLIFLFCFMSFAIILVLGGGPAFTTLEVEVYRAARIDVDLPRAARLAIAESSVTLAILFLYVLVQRRTGSVATLSDRTGLPAPMKSRVRSVLIAGYALLFLVVVLGPLIAMVANSFLRRSGWSGSLVPTITWYRELIVPGDDSRFASTAFRAAVTSFTVAAAAAVSAAFLGTLLARSIRRRGPGSAAAEGLAMLPMGVSQIVLGLGYLQTSRFLPFPFAGTWAAVIVAHAVIAYPFVLRSVGAAYRQIPPEMLLAARSLGAGRGTLFRTIEFPLLRPAVAAGTVFAFAISLGEMSATIMLIPPGGVTMPLAIYRLIGSYQYFAACALGTLLLLACSAAFFLIDSVDPETREEFE